MAQAAGQLEARPEPQPDGPLDASLNTCDELMRSLAPAGVDDGILIPLKTTLELHDERMVCGEVLITRAPVKCASAVIRLALKLFPVLLHAESHPLSLTASRSELVLALSAGRPLPPPSLPYVLSCLIVARRQPALRPIPFVPCTDGGACLVFCATCYLRT